MLKGKRGALQALYNQRTQRSSYAEDKKKTTLQGHEELWVMMLSLEYDEYKGENV